MAFEKNGQAYFTFEEIETKIEKHQAYYQKKFNQYLSIKDNRRGLRRLVRLMTLSNLTMDLIMQRHNMLLDGLYMEVVSNDN